MTKDIYNVGFGIWNKLISIAVTLFTTSPTKASEGEVYATAKSLYDAISDISIPIATVFFLIAIFRDVVSAPPDQQTRKLFGSGLKYTIMLGILANLWLIMGYVIQIADGITAKFESAESSYTMSMDNHPDLLAAITEIEDLSIWDGNNIFAKIMLFLAAIITLIITVSSCISILSSAFQRIIKPLVILPFAAITVALGAGSGESTRVMTQYLKTFFGFCISGAFMIVCVIMGVSLSDGLISFDMASLSTYEKALYNSVQCAITPIVIAGLVKTADSIIGKFF